MVKKGFVARTEIIEASFAAGGVNEAIFGAAPIANKAYFTLPAITG